MPMVHPFDNSSHSLFISGELDLYLTTVSDKIKNVSFLDKDQVKRYISVPNQQMKTLQIS